MDAEKIKKTKCEVDPRAVVRDLAVYPRVGGTDWRTTQRYRDVFLTGGKFPPITVARRGDELICIDGWHRLEAAIDAKVELIAAEIMEDLPEAEWFPLAVKLNIGHGRQLTYQDRAAIADRLERECGYSLEAITQILRMPLERIAELRGRVVTTQDGERVVLKSAVAHQVGTSQEGLAASSQDPLANCSAKRTLDEMIALLNAKAFDLTSAEITLRLRTVRDRLIEIELGDEPSLV